jgi:hypothetical protein
MSSTASQKQRKQDALELAQTLYDIFIEQRNNDNIEDGQNNANQTKDH